MIAGFFIRGCMVRSLTLRELSVMQPQSVPAAASLGRFSSFVWVGMALPFLL